MSFVLMSAENTAARSAVRMFFILPIILFSSETTAAKSYCTAEIERTLEAHRLLLEGLHTVSNPALQDLVIGYLGHNQIVCAVEDIIAVQVDRYIISRDYSGNNNVSFVFSATHKTGCSLHLAIDTPSSHLRNVVARCSK